MKVVNYGQTLMVRTIIMGSGAATRLELSPSPSCHEEAHGEKDMRFFEPFEHIIKLIILSPLTQRLYEVNSSVNKVAIVAVIMGL